MCLLRKRLRCLPNDMLRGRVITGLGEGRKLGYPTANLDCDDTNVEGGVYAAFVVYRGHEYPAALMIGGDFGTDTKRKVEVHLLGEDMSLVGEELAVRVVARVSAMEHVSGLPALHAKIDNDIRMIQVICLQAL